MDSQTAKAASLAYLQAHSIPFIDSLPLLESLDELSPRDAKAVARRIMVLSYICGIGFDFDASELEASLERVGLAGDASERERDLLSRREHTPQERANATWLIECIQALSWCLCIADLDPFEPCDADIFHHFPKIFEDPSKFISGATIRPIDEIYLQADLHYRLHWAARNARLDGSGSTLHEGRIGERRRALDWVIGVESNWDEISLDT
jgi:hypothetical protein